MAALMSLSTNDEAHARIHAMIRCCRIDDGKLSEKQETEIIHEIKSKPDLLIHVPPTGEAWSIIHEIVASGNVKLLNGILREVVVNVKSLLDLKTGDGLNVLSVARLGSSSDMMHYILELYSEAVENSDIQTAASHSSECDDGFLQKILYIVRHGQSTANVVTDYRDANHSDFLDTPLSKHGILQAKQLSEFMETLSSDEVPEVVIVSPLRRAVQTANYGLSCLGKPFVLSPRIRECTYWTEFQSRAAPGSSIRQFVEEANLTCAQLITTASMDPLDQRLDPYWQPEEEATTPDEDLFRRGNEAVASVLPYLMTRPEKVLAVVAHWGVIWKLLKQFGFIDAPNCGVYRLAVQLSPSGEPEIVSYDHLWSPKG